MSDSQASHGLTSSTFFLERMKLDTFGAFSNTLVGPFKPGLNVVYGKNEAGKTTLNAFVGGVLFGWEDARGYKNTYRPENAERVGSLFFRTPQGEELTYSRTKNTDGLQGPEEYLVDIDKETFQTMFALTSDELLGLRNTTDVTAKLLTAGSGTGSSPAEALKTIQSKLGEYTSRAAGFEHSLVNLEQRKQELRFSISQAADEAEQFKQEDKEYHELMPQKEMLATKLHELNNEIEELTAAKATLEKLDTQIQQEEQQKSRLDRELKELEAEQENSRSPEWYRIERISSIKEKALREQIDVFMEAEAKLDHRASIAKDNLTASSAVYEALLEADNFHDQDNKEKRQRQLQTILSILFPSLFTLVGVPLFISGRNTNSLSLTALGMGLIIFALVLAAAALAMIFRPQKSEEEKQDRKKDAQWVMLQDKKKLESCAEEKESLKQEIVEYLLAEGLGDAQASLRRARTILDELAEQRAQDNLISQRKQALASQASSVETALEQNRRQRQDIATKVSGSASISADDLGVLIQQRSQQRGSVLETSEKVNRRYGEIKQELAQAKNMREFDKLKLEYEETCTQLEESTQNYARLVLAAHMLESAIAAWESKSQPEVYKQASRLLEKMTAGAWVQVRLSEKGKLEVIDAVKSTREPLYLSTGTCQQLYLSLRIALLMTAENVGKMIPIMADDILVNFDEERRKGAAEALLELASKRQVIIFTCHQEIVRLMCDIDSQVNLVEL